MNVSFPNAELILQPSADNFKPGASLRCKGRTACMRSYTSGLGGDDLERHWDCGAQPRLSRNTNNSDHSFHSIYSHRTQ